MARSKLFGEGFTRRYCTCWRRNPLQKSCLMVKPADRVRERPPITPSADQPIFHSSGMLSSWLSRSRRTASSPPPRTWLDGWARRRSAANRRRQDRPHTTVRRPQPAPARIRHPPVSIPDLHEFLGARCPWLIYYDPAALIIHARINGIAVLLAVWYASTVISALEGAIKGDRRNYCCNLLRI